MASPVTYIAKSKTKIQLLGNDTTKPLIDRFLYRCRAFKNVQPDFIWMNIFYYTVDSLQVRTSIFIPINLTDKTYTHIHLCCIQNNFFLCKIRSFICKGFGQVHTCT